MNNSKSFSSLELPRQVAAVPRTTNRFAGVQLSNVAPSGLFGGIPVVGPLLDQVLGGVLGGI